MKHFSFVFKSAIAVMIVATVALSAIPVFAAGNIDATQKYSQFIDVDLDSNGTDDFINWSPTNGGATVGDSTITGYIWGEGVGWINLGPLSASGAGVTNTCAGVLGGYAWGQHTGWINFAPAEADIAPNVNTGTGQITGQVWAQNYGWIELASANVTYPGLDSSWSGCPATGGGSGSSPTIRQCNDGDDNDSDGLIDPLDPGCHTDGNPNNPATYVPLDDSELDTAPPDPIDPIDPTDPTDPIDPITTDDDNDVIPLFPDVPADTNALLPISIFEIENNRFPWLPGAMTILAIAGLLSTIPSLISRFGSLLFTFFFLRKKQRGVVYDSKTKQPIDPAYVSVIDMATGREIMNQITDMNGRYGFILAQGRYRMTASKTNYKFPSVYLAGKSNDEVYDHIYFGEEFIVADREQVVVMNIPMDPIGVDWNQQEKQRMNPIKFMIENQGNIMWLFNVLFAVGFVASILITWFYPIIWNIIMTALYVIVVGIEAYGLGPVTVGRIMKNGRPVKNAIIRVYNVALGREVAHKVTTEQGSYYLLVPKSDYYITVEEPQPDGTYVKIFTSGTLRASHGLINKSFTIT